MSENEHQDLFDHTLNDLGLLQAVVNNTAEYISVHDFEGRYQKLLSHQHNRFGYLASDFISQSVFDFVHPEDQGIVKEFWQKNLIAADNSAIKPLCEYRFVLADGGWVWLESSLSVLTADQRQNQKQPQVLCISRDISKRKENEIAMQKTKERYETAIEGSQDGLWDWNIKTDYTWHSDRFATMLGYEPDELPYTSAAWSDLLHPDDKDNAIKIVEDYFANPNDGIYESRFRMRHKNGSWHWIIGRGKAILDADGQVERLIGFNTDITDLQKALHESERMNNQLQMERQLAQQYLELASVILVSLDLNGTITMANKRACECLGYQKDDIIGLNWFENCLPDDVREQVFTVFQSIMNGHLEQLAYHENQVVTRNGVLRDVNWHNTLLYNSQGEIRGLLSAGEDVTEKNIYIQRLKESENRLQAAEQMARMGHYQMDFLSDHWSSSHGLDELFGINANYERNTEGWLQIVHPSYRAQMLQYLNEEVLTRGQTFDKQYLVINQRTNAELWVHGHGKLEFDPNGQVKQMFGTIQDITQQKERESALQLSEKRFQAAAEGSRDGLWDWNLDTGYVFHSERFAQILGYKGNELPYTIGAWQDLIHPEDISETFRQIEKYLEHASNEAFNFEFRMRHRDGHWLWVMAQAKALLDKHGQPDRFIGFLSDITDRKLYQQQLQQSESQFHEMFTQHNTIMMLVDPEDQNLILDANQAALDFYGYNLEEFRAMSVLELNQLSHEQLKDLIESARNKKQNVFEFKHRTKDGTIKDVEVHSSPIHVNDRVVLYSIVRDITLSKANEKRLRMLSTVVEESPAYIIITDPAGSIQYCNQAFERITGYRFSEVVGQNPGFLKSGHVSPEFYRQMWQTISSGQVWRGEFENQRKNGELYYDAGLIAPIMNQQGEIIHYFAIKEDITERKKVELDLIEAKQKAEAASVAKNMFLGNMSHEIRTPMNAIIGMTDLALQGDLNPEVRQYLKTVKDASDHLLDLINDVLDASRLDADKQDLNQSNFPMEHIVNRCVNLLRVKAQEKGLELRTDLDLDLEQQYLGDARRISQVLINLLGNAIKFTDQGFVELQIQKASQGQITFIVRDSGRGIEPDMYEVVFDKFTQVNKSTKSYVRRDVGSGLGLYISQRLVRSMGGEIKLESELGRGSEFSFTIPLKPIETTSGVSGQTVAVTALSSLDILLAEDIAVNALLAQAVLKKNKHQVTVAQNGREVLQMLAKQNFDLILMDIEMPIMDGVETTIRIRQGEAGDANKAIPILAITAHVLEDIQNRCMDAGMDGFISKPIDVLQLNTEIARVISKKRPQ